MPRGGERQHTPHHGTTKTRSTPHEPHSRPDGRPPRGFPRRVRAGRGSPDTTTPGAACPAARTHPTARTSLREELLLRLVVQKFGGTSVATATRIMAAARRAIRAGQEGHQV